MRYAQFIAVEREQLAPENSFIVAIRQAMTNLFPAAIQCSRASWEA
jgi:hypothetical protein